MSYPGLQRKMRRVSARRRGCDGFDFQLCENLNLLLLCQCAIFIILLGGLAWSKTESEVYGCSSSVIRESNRKILLELAAAKGLL